MFKWISKIIDPLLDENGDAIRVEEKRIGNAYRKETYFLGVRTWEESIFLPNRNLKHARAEKRELVTND